LTVDRTCPLFYLPDLHTVITVEDTERNKFSLKNRGDTSGIHSTFSLSQFTFARTSGWCSHRIAFIARVWSGL